MSDETDEQRRERVAEIRQAHARLSDILTQGTAYSETVKVGGRDRKEYEVRVYALSDDDVRQAFEKSGADPKDIGDREKLVSNLKLLAEVAKSSTGDADICKAIMPMGLSKIAMKAFEISGLTREPGAPLPDLTTSSAQERGQASIRQR